MSAFVSGQELGQRLVEGHVHPLMLGGFPDVLYSAALLGRGSEMLGFDDAMSRDRNWEPGVFVLISERDHTKYHELIEQSFAKELPTRFAGYPTQYSVWTLRRLVQSAWTWTWTVRSQPVTG